MGRTYSVVNTIKEGRGDPTHVYVVKDERGMEYIKKKANPALKDTGNKLVQNETNALEALVGGSGNGGSGKENGLQFVILNKAPGRSLDKVVHDLRKTGATREGTPSEEYIARAITLYAGILTELKEVHGKKVAHHDVIPSNVVADSSLGVKLVDFAHAGKVKAAAGIEHFVSFNEGDKTGLERSAGKYQQDSSYSPFNVEWSHDEMTEDSFRKNEATGAIQINHDVYMATNILHWMLTGKRLGERTAAEEKKKVTDVLFPRKGTLKKRYAALNDVFTAAENIMATEYNGDAILALLEEKEKELLGKYRIKKPVKGTMGAAERESFESALATAGETVREARESARRSEQALMVVQGNTSRRIEEAEGKVRSAEERAAAYGLQHDGLSRDVDSLVGFVNTGAGSRVLPGFRDARISGVCAAITAAESAKAGAMGKYTSATREITAWRTLSNPKELYRRLKSEGKDKLIKYGGMALAGAATLALVVGIGGFLYGRMSAPKRVVEKPVIQEIYVTSPEVEVMLAPVTEYCQTSHNTQDLDVCMTGIQAGEALREQYQEESTLKGVELAAKEVLIAAYDEKVGVLEAENRRLKSSSGSGDSDLRETLDRYVRETRPQAALAIVALYETNQVQLACDMAVHFKSFYGGRGITGELKTVMSDLKDSTVCRGKL